jgi:hypothetical protein
MRLSLWRKGEKERNCGERKPEFNEGKLSRIERISEINDQGVDLVERRGWAVQPRRITSLH